MTAQNLNLYSCYESAKAIQAQRKQAMVLIRVGLGTPTYPPHPKKGKRGKK